jgi:hypothetical protein
MNEMAMNGVPGTAEGSTLQSWMGVTEAALAERLSPKLLKKAAQSDRAYVKGWLTVAGQKGISGCVADKVSGLAGGCHWSDCWSLEQVRGVEAMRAGDVERSW